MDAPPSEQQDRRDMVGRVLGGVYEVLRPLGSGGMGTVYLGRHRQQGHEVAIKVLPASSSSREASLRFRQEASTLEHLRHPNIVNMLDAGATEDAEYLVIEYVRGRSLHDEIAAGPLAWERAVHIGHQIASALSVAHAAGVVHRDLKPANIMLTEQGGGRDHVKVLDFGIAKLLETCAEALGGPQGLTAAGMVLGTPRYMAPEQCMGEPIDGRADLYSLGVLLYEMVLGACPFVGASHADTFRAQVMDPVPPLPPRVRGAPVPEPFRQLIYALLAKQPQDRPAPVDQVAQRIAALVTPPSAARRPAGPARGIEAAPPGAAPLATAAPQPPPAGARRRLHPLVSAAIGGGAALLLAALLGLALRWCPPA